VDSGLVRLSEVKLALGAASDRASREIRDCATCDARCCKVGFNSMLVTRIEARAIADRLAEPDLAPRISEIVRRAREETARRGLDRDPAAKYDCPLLDEGGRCLVHGPAQPVGCLTFRPVADGGCDHDLPLFRKHIGKVRKADRAAFGKGSDPLPIPVAILKALDRAGGSAPSATGDRRRRGTRPPRSR
jgi:hypothetical protein